MAMNSTTGDYIIISSGSTTANSTWNNYTSTSTSANTWTTGGTTYSWDIQYNPGIIEEPEEVPWYDGGELD